MSPVVNTTVIRMATGITKMLVVKTSQANRLSMAKMFISAVMGNKLRGLYSIGIIIYFVTTMLILGNYGRIDTLNPKVIGTIQVKMAIHSLENKLSMVKKSTSIIKVFKSKVTLAERTIAIQIKLSITTLTLVQGSEKKVQFRIKKAKPFTSRTMVLNLQEYVKLMVISTISKHVKLPLLLIPASYKKESAFYQKKGKIHHVLMVLVPLLILPVATILTQLLVKPLKIAMSKKMMAGTIMLKMEMQFVLKMVKSIQTVKSFTSMPMVVKLRESLFSTMVFFATMILILEHASLTPL